MIDKAKITVLFWYGAILRSLVYIFIAGLSSFGMCAASWPDDATVPLTRKQIVIVWVSVPTAMLTTLGAFLDKTLSTLQKKKDEDDAPQLHG